MVDRLLNRLEASNDAEDREASENIMHAAGQMFVGEPHIDFALSPV